MAVVTGTLYDISGGHLAGKFPDLVFTLNDTAATSGGVYVTEPSVVTPGSDGSFTANLPSTDLMRDDNYYSLQIRWLDTAGNTSRVDFPDWKIRVPTAGGNIVDLRGGGSNLSIVYVSLTAPDHPIPYMLWLEQDPDDTTNPANTGNLYRWENI
jgi:hypothetical protein